MEEKKSDIKPMRFFEVLTAISFLYGVFALAFLFCGLCGKRNTNTLWLIWIAIEIVRTLVSTLQISIGYFLSE